MLRVVKRAERSSTPTWSIVGVFLKSGSIIVLLIISFWDSNKDIQKNLFELDVLLFVLYLKQSKIDYLSEYQFTKRRQRKIT